MWYFLHSYSFELNKRNLPRRAFTASVSLRTGRKLDCFATLPMHRARLPNAAEVVLEDLRSCRMGIRPADAMSSTAAAFDAVRMARVRATAS